MKEIGGYLELDNYTGAEYYDRMISLNLGRTAALYALKAMNIRILWVPDFLCDSVIQTCIKAGYQLKYYSIDKNFLPLLDKPAENMACVYITNYYGQLSQEAVEKMKEKYGTILLDNTHSFFQPPLPGIPTVYSLRKFFGLTDGAYLSLDGVDTWLDADMLEQDCSHDRMKHVLGRYERTAADYYGDMLANAHGLEEEGLKRMSKLTKNLLRGIDYEYVKKVRESNFAYLHEQLGSDNDLKITAPEGPFAYPFYCKDGMRLRRKMAEYRIYVPTYWKNVMETMPQTSVEYDYAANILPLPCDQRYGQEEMDTICSVLKKCSEELEI